MVGDYSGKNVKEGEINGMEGGGKGLLVEN
jgi:hypothetical protein